MRTMLIGKTAPGLAARCAIGLAIVIASAGTAVQAQHALPTPAADAPNAAAASPAAKPAADAPAAPTSAPASTPTAVPAATPSAGETAPATAPSAPADGAAAASDAANDRARQQEWARLAQQRAEVQLMLARAREASKHAAPPAEREPEPVRHGDAGAAFALGLSLETPWYTDPGYDAFAEDDVATRFGVWASYDVASLREDAFLAVELGWGTESEHDEVLGVADTKLRTHVAYAGATVRWVPISWLQPHVRLAGGTAIVDAELESRGVHYHDGAGGPFEDMLSPFGSAGLGFTLRTRTRAFEDRRGRLASLSFGLMFEGGYTLAKPIDVALDGPGPSARDIALSEPQLGELERSGPYFRVSLVGRM